jgi:hypothetical protein
MNARHGAITGLFLSSLALTVAGALASQRVWSPPALTIEWDAAARARLDAMESALVELLAAARPLGEPAARARLERALDRFERVGAPLAGVLVTARRGETWQLVEAMRRLPPRIGALGHEILAAPAADLAPKLALLERLGGRALVALRQLRETAGLDAAPARSEKIARPAAGAEGFTLPEGVAMLLLAAACAAGMAFLSRLSERGPLRRALATGSHRWRSRS